MRPPAVQSVVSSHDSLILYRPWGRIGLSAIRPAGAVMTAILVGLAAGGCSVSRSDGPFARMEGKEVTGTITPPPVKDPQPTDSDLAFARNAASDVLSKGDGDASQHWENPETGARGSVTPLAQAYAAEDGRRCRDFLASYVNGRTETWLQGHGCDTGHGRWEIHTLKPWRS